MHRPLRLLSGLAILVAALAVAAPRAHGDLSPPDSCTSPGQPCTTAGPQYNAAGTCVATTCTKQVPAPDGGTMPMTYDCNRCEVQGGGGAGGSTSPSSGSSGCAVAPEPDSRQAVALPVVLIAGVMVSAARRRRRRSAE